MCLHDIQGLQENNKVKSEVCVLCGQRFLWRKTKMGRINNKEYLEAHARNFAQPTGKTKRIFYKSYHPELCIIKL